MLLEKELVKVANSMLESPFLRITREVSWDIDRPVLEMDLSIAAPALSQQVPSTLLDNEMPEVLDDPVGNDLSHPVATPFGYQQFCGSGRWS